VLSLFKRKKKLSRPMSTHTPIECNRMYLWAFVPIKTYTTFSNGSLGSRIDEERSEMR
jgi:hypothetical protein